MLLRRYTTITNKFTISVRYMEVHIWNLQSLTGITDEGRRLLRRLLGLRISVTCKAPLNESPLYMVLYKVLRCKIENLMETT